jgi:hypothetical protein
MDQGVIVPMKQHYQAGILRTRDDEDNMTAFWRKITVLDAVYSVSWVWFTVEPVILV